MKTNRFTEQCLKAKAAGYEYISSVVATCKATTYYHCNSLDDLIRAGKWIPAAHGTFPSARKLNSSWHGRVGVMGRHLPEKTLPKMLLYKL